MTAGSSLYITSSPLLISNNGILWLADMGGVRALDLVLGVGVQVQLVCLSPVSSLYGPASNADSHDHVIGLMGSAFNEGVLLDTNH